MGLHAMYDAMRTGRPLPPPTPRPWVVEFYNPYFGPVRSQPDRNEYATRADAEAEAAKLRGDGIEPVVVYRPSSPRGQ